MLKTLLNIIYRYFVAFVESRRAQMNKRRSLRALEKLDDRLLDDIGLRRSGDGDIVSIHSRPVSVMTEANLKSLQEVQAQQARRRTGRLRHPYLLRRRL